MKIWKDQWIDSPLSNKIQSLVSCLLANANVFDLIDKQHKRWNTSLIQQILSPNEVKPITVILISYVERLDKLFWFRSKDGHFTVRSAYHFQHSLSLSS